MIEFAGLGISAYQTADINYSIQFVETRLLTGEIFVNLSTEKRAFPRRFDCYPTDYSEISGLVALIGIFGTLTIDGTEYTNCYISQLGGIKELIKGSGKYVYYVVFSQADKH